MESTNQHFGLVIAYLLPGLIALGGIALIVPLVAEWLKPVPGGTGLGPPVYAVLAAIAVGMIISCVRWLIIDHVHAWTSVRPPTWEIVRLEKRLGVFNYFVEYHYRYYQFYANTLIALIWTYGLNRWFMTSPLFSPATDVAVLILCSILFAGSRDSLSKYYDRTKALLSGISE